ncbi:MAG: hypothetical protein AAF329_17750 [Cyanobacteria bacterium P01_A01_bin.17]
MNVRRTAAVRQVKETSQKDSHPRSATGVAYHKVAVPGCCNQPGAVSRTGVL